MTRSLFFLLVVAVVLICAQETSAQKRRCNVKNNEVWNDCGSNCPSRCSKPNSGPCNRACNPNCFCKNGLLRREFDNACVRYEDCFPNYY